MQPLFGALSDRIGRRNSMLCFGVFTVLATVPILTALSHVTDPFAAFGLVLLALAGVSFYTSISGLVKAELFPMHVRALGVGALLRDRQRELRRQRRVRRAVGQIDRHRVDLLLVCDRSCARSR